MREQIIISNVPPERLEHFRGWARSLGGTLVSVAPEPDGEFTLIIFFPKE